MGPEIIRIAGTGHRPDKLGGYSQFATQKLIDFAKHIVETIRSANTDTNKEIEIISGLALGWDTALATACRELRIPYAVYIPCEGQESRWPEESRFVYRELRSAASREMLVSDGGYEAWKMQRRNQKMVNDCQLVLALWNGSDGGTANCLHYAKRVEKPIANVWEQWEEFR